VLRIASILVLSLAGTFVAPEVMAQPGASVIGQRNVSLRGRTSQAQKLVTTISGKRSAWLKSQRKLSARYKKQLAEIDNLKRRRSSWRRNRELKRAYGESQATAKKLATYDKRVRRLAKELTRARRALWQAIDAELLSSTDPRRRSVLERIRRARTRQPTRRRRIVLPDDRIDPLASAEELEEQARLLAQSEAQLAREIDNLDRREKRLVRMAKLRTTRLRAAEMGALDDNNPRRTTGRLVASNNRSTGGNDSDSAGDPAPGESGQAPGPEGDSGGGTTLEDAESGGDYSLIFADVVDTPTLNAYRSADQSGDPKRRAKAARRMRVQAQTRLKELRQRRKEMLDRARRQGRP